MLHRPYHFKTGGIVLLKVGELAKGTGLTIRALHYYDKIGLLKPSGRSQSGYRLYNQSDIARLHGIQALRRLGLPLGDISRLFKEGSASLPLIISQQIEALDHEMAKAAELRSRLLFIQEKFASGFNPEIEEWLSTLDLMATYSRYFSPDELRKILANWNQLLGESQPLIADIRSAMKRAVSVSSPEVQTLARRWMDLSLRWMEGNFELIQRWGNMCRHEPITHGSSGIDAAFLEYISMAIDLRLEAFHRHLNPAQLQRLKQVPEEEWTSIGLAAERMIHDGVSVYSEPARQLAIGWSKLVDRLTDNDPAIRECFLVAVQSEPIIQAGLSISTQARGYIRDACLAAVSSPAAPPSKIAFAPA